MKIMLFKTFIFLIIVAAAENSLSGSYQQHIDQGALLDYDPPRYHGCINPDVDGDGAASIECGGDDCDDYDRKRFLGNTEVCDVYGHDEDCNPSTFGGRDQDGDGFESYACGNYDEYVYPGRERRQEQQRSLEAEHRSDHTRLLNRWNRGEYITARDNAKWEAWLEMTRRSRCNADDQWSGRCGRLGWRSSESYEAWIERTRRDGLYW